MNIHINHFSLGARNAFESAARLRKETGSVSGPAESVRDISCRWCCSATAASARMRSSRFNAPSTRTAI